MNRRYALEFRATVPVEPFAIERDHLVTKGRQYVREDYLFEVTAVRLYVTADDATERIVTVEGFRLKKDGTRYAIDGTEHEQWVLLPEQAQQACRAAYAEAVAGVQPVLNPDPESSPKPDETYTVKDHDGDVWAYNHDSGYWEPIYFGGQGWDFNNLSNYLGQDFEAWQRIAGAPGPDLD